MEPIVKSSFAANQDARKSWEEPQIVLKRSLLVSAQEGTTGAPPVPGAPPGPGVLGPLSASVTAGSNDCF
jgi:hypothetical protein